MYKIKLFSQYFSINEAESSGKEDTEIISGAIKKGMVSTIKKAFFDIEGGEEGDFETASGYQSQPYTGCGAKSPYSVNKIPELVMDEADGNLVIGKARLIATLKVLNDKGKGDYKRTLEDIKNGKAVLIGIRRKLEERKKNDDLFCDYIGFLGTKPTDRGKRGVFFHGTTCPSLKYFGNKPMNEKGIGIKAPGETLYVLKKWKPNNPKIPAYTALVEGESVQVYRYPKGTESYEKANTYKPGSLMKESVGMHIHRSSTGETEGICVGPWSAGCQVLAKGSDFDKLISLCEERGQENFMYALFQEDDYLELKSEIDKVREQIIKENQPIVSKDAKPNTGDAAKKA